MDERLPKVKSPWTVDEQLHGWNEAQTKFFSSNVSSDAFHLILLDHPSWL